MTSIWKPHVAVAAVVERDGRLLFVEETTSEGVRINQPAGHWEPEESLIDAVIRETREETAHSFRPEFLIGVYRWKKPQTGTVFLRFAFGGTLLGHDPAQPLDQGILRFLWLTRAELAAAEAAHRSPLVSLCVRDYDAGVRYPLHLLQHLE